MTPMGLNWQWPESVISIVVIIVFGLIANLAVTLLIRRWVRYAEKAKPSQRFTGGGKNRDEASDDGESSLPLVSKLKSVTAALTDAQNRHRARVKTIATLLHSIANAFIWSVVIVMVLGVVGLPLGPILTSAGIGGIAIAFGAQSLFKDFISGIFMVVEDQFGVGDVVTVGDLTGTVVDVSLRVTKIRDGAGQIWFIRNGEITKLGNQSQGTMSHTLTIPVGVDTDHGTVVDVLTKVCAEFNADGSWDEVLLTEPVFLGLGAADGRILTYQVQIKTSANQHWAAARALRATCVEALTQAGVSTSMTSNQASDTKTT